MRRGENCGARERVDWSSVNERVCERTWNVGTRIGSGAQRLCHARRRGALAYERYEVGNRDPLLIRRIAVANGDGLVLQRLEVHGNAQRRAGFVVATMLVRNIDSPRDMSPRTRV